jgi:hypothetical protein
MGSSISSEKLVNHNQLDGRVESPRTGGIQGTLGAGRSLVSEGLRAAGLRKKVDDDVFGGDVADGTGVRRPKSANVPIAGSSRAHRRESVDWVAELERERSQSRASVHSSARVSDGSSSSRRQQEPQTPDPSSSTFSANRSSISGSRPPTSMAESRRGELENDANELSLSRTYTPARVLAERERERNGAGSSIGRHHTGQDRALPSPSAYHTRRYSPLPSASQQQQQTMSEHTRLMLESLTVFESNLARLPSMGNTTTTIIPDLFRSAQTIVPA